MGSCCGKQSKDNFDTPGRTLGAAPAPKNGTVPVPKQAKPKVGGPPRTLGGQPSSGSDARSAAAAAAEARANRTASGGLNRKLAEDKRQNRGSLLQQAARENLAHRQADAATEARNYN